MDAMATAMDSVINGFGALSKALNRLVHTDNLELATVRAKVLQDFLTELLLLVPKGATLVATIQYVDKALPNVFVLAQNELTFRAKSAPLNEAVALRAALVLAKGLIAANDQLSKKRSTPPPPPEGEGPPKGTSGEDRA